MKNTKVLFVCLGNICRSPTAHGVFQKMVDDEGLGQSIEVESAGTSGWHIGESPDARSSAAAAKRGYDLSISKGRKAVVSDFDYYDFILAMDENNLAELQAICPSHFTGHLGLFLSFGAQNEGLEVPDPYYGGAKGFETVLDLVEDACQGLLAHIKKS